MNFNECLQWLNISHVNNYPSSLPRFKQKLQELNCYPTSPKIFTVAGTNGKGTTCVTLEAILLAAGYTVGCYLSPHLLKITERIRINGKDVSEEEFVQAFSEVFTREKINWFEFISLLAMKIFAQYELDFLILEVGIGGRNDVINAIDSDVAIITSIDLDHTEILGYSREQIGYEKAGIFRANKVAICADPNPPQSAIDYAEEIGVKLIIAPTEAVLNALRVLPETAHISPAAIKTGLQKVFLPGRFQIIKQQPWVICDVAHNPHAARYLAERLAQQSCLGRTYAIVGMQTKKDIPNTLAPMLKIVDQWYISNVGAVSALTFVELAGDFLQQSAAQFIVTETITAALAAVLQIAHAEDRIVVFGSFLTIEEVMQAKCLLA